MIYLDIAREIERKRRLLHSSIRKNGIDSEKTRRISVEIDNLINEYCKKEREYNENNTMIVYYKKSLKELRNLMLDTGSFPNVKVWNEYALKNNCLNYVSMEYISGSNWHELERKIKFNIIKKL